MARDVRGDRWLRWAYDLLGGEFVQRLLRSVFGSWALWCRQRQGQGVGLPRQLAVAWQFESLLFDEPEVLYEGLMLERVKSGAFGEHEVLRICRPAGASAKCPVKEHPLVGGVLFELEPCGLVAEKVGDRDTERQSVRIFSISLLGSGGT